MEWWYPEFSCQFLYTVTISLLLLCHVFGCTTRVSIITFYSFFISNTKRNLLHSTHLLCHPRMLSIIYLFLFLNFTFCLSITFHYFYSNNFLVLFFSFLSFFLVHTSNWRLCSFISVIVRVSVLRMLWGSFFYHTTTWSMF